MSKPPSRKHYEKVKPTYKELESKITILEHNHFINEQYVRELKGLIRELRVVSDWFHVLNSNEVMILTPEGMKYLVGQDLENFCKAEVEKKLAISNVAQNFKSFATLTLSQIISDEIDKGVLQQHLLDAYNYITKGRYDDARSKSKKEGS